MFTLLAIGLRWWIRFGVVAERVFNGGLEYGGEPRFVLLILNTMAKWKRNGLLLLFRDEKIRRWINLWVYVVVRNCRFEWRREYVNFDNYLGWNWSLWQSLLLPNCRSGILTMLRNLVIFCNIPLISSRWFTC